jgi:large subunit ribosomal protein L4
MKQAVYNLKKEKVKEIDLAKNIFGLEVNHDLLNQVVYVYNSNQRKGTAHTKTKANVRGGGRKPWRQKGTGNARTGSIRNPIFRGGGIIFGPTKEKIYKRKINKKVKLKAFLSVLSSKVKDTQMIIFDDFKFKKPNTKKLVKVLAKFEAKQK